MTRVEQIMQEERARTLQQIDGLQCPELVRSDIVRLMSIIQFGVNEFVAQENRTLDGLTVPSALRLSLDEMSRVWDRLNAEGLTGAPETE